MGVDVLAGGSRPKWFGYRPVPITASGGTATVGVIFGVNDPPAPAAGASTLGHRRHQQHHHLLAALTHVPGRRDAASAAHPPEMFDDIEPAVRRLTVGGGINLRVRWSCPGRRRRSARCATAPAPARPE